MAVAVISPGRKREFAPRQEQAVDPLDQIIKGLQIASTVYGIKHNIDQNDLNKLQQTKLQQDLASQETLMKQQGEELAVQKDPSSQESVLSRKLAQKYTGQVIPETATAYDLRNIIDPKKMLETEASGKATLERSMQIEGAKSKAQESAQAAKFAQEEKMAGLKGKGEAVKSKMLPAASAESFASSNASLQALEAANAAVQSSQAPTGPFLGRVSGAMGAMELGDTGKAAKTLDAQLKLNAQTIGKYLEGGKLTDADIDRYKQMLPNLTDSPEAAQKKTQLLQTLISQKQQSELQTFGQSGYDVSNIQRYQPNIGAVRSSGQQAFGLPSAQAAQNDFSTQAQYILQQRAKSKGK